MTVKHPARRRVCVPANLPRGLSYLNRASISRTVRGDLRRHGQSNVPLSLVAFNIIPGFLHRHTKYCDLKFDW